MNQTTPTPLPGAPNGGWMLAIDTSTGHAGIALGDGSRVVARSWEADRAQTTSVLPAIDALCAEVGIAPREIAAVAVASGPGTFTGLRVGMGIAKGLVLAGDIPLVAVPTLEVAARAVDARDIVAVLPAGRGRVAWQRFGDFADATPHNTTVPELAAALATMPGALVTGELAADHRDVVAAAHPNVNWAMRDPAILLAMGQDRLARGEIADPVTLEPTYLHGLTVSAGPVQDRLKRPSRT